jgi:hypothetical protein
VAILDDRRPCALYEIELRSSSSATRAVMLPSGVVMFCASAPFALLATVAHRVRSVSIGMSYGWVQVPESGRTRVMWNFRGALAPAPTS